MKHPWETEPDRKDWEAHGYPCVVNRSKVLKHLTGYVGVPEGHPWQGKTASEIHAQFDIEVHGGLSFSDPGNQEFFNCKAPWWVGFDCGHWGDLKPGLVGTEFEDPYSYYRDFAFVIRNTELLAKQAAEAAKEAV